jgi:hypothetical protein
MHRNRKLNLDQADRRFNALPASGNAGPIDQANELVSPLFRLLHGKALPFNGRYEPACRTYKQWQDMEPTPAGTWRNDDPRRVIPQLIRGRINVPPYPSSKEKTPLYVMSAPQVLDFVGIAEPTVFHLQLAADTLTDLLGEPKKVFCRDRWLINPRGNDDALNPQLAKKYRVPARRDFQWREGLASFNASTEEGGTR